MHPLQRQVWPLEFTPSLPQLVRPTYDAACYCKDTRPGSAQRIACFGPPFTHCASMSPGALPLTLACAAATSSARPAATRSSVCPTSTTRDSFEFASPATASSQRLGVTAWGRGQRQAHRLYVPEIQPAGSPCRNRWLSNKISTAVIRRDSLVVPPVAPHVGLSLPHITVK